jgi:hypothetical protein
MADLPLEGRVVEDKKEVPLTDAQRLDLLTQDVQELARGINTQARLLESIILAFDHVVKKYLDLTRKPDESKEKPQE